MFVIYKKIEDRNIKLFFVISIIFMNGDRKYKIYRFLNCK